MPPAPGLSGNTLRQTLRTTVAGKQLRLRFANLFGDGPLTMDAVQLAASAGPGLIRAGSGKAVLFHGAASVQIPQGGTVISDVLDYDLAPMSDLAITIHFGDVPGALTGHPGSRSNSFIQAGNTMDAADMTQGAKTAHWYVITGIDVLRADVPGVVVVMGDSITDGRGSTTDGNDRWTDVLARRLHDIPVLNEGLGGNAVLTGGLGPPAVTRLDRDVFGQSSARWMIVLEGVNDIGVSRSATVADDLIAAFGQFIEKAHSHGVRVYGVPILPFGRSMYSSPAHETARQTVNNWIRTSGKFDAVIDMDAGVRDPDAPANLLAEYDSGDHLHLNPAGYRKMAEVIDLGLFGK
jgi:lysophospholipase L1-like esterase